MGVGNRGKGLDHSGIIHEGIDSPKMIQGGFNGAAAGVQIG